MQVLTTGAELDKREGHVGRAAKQDAANRRLVNVVVQIANRRKKTVK